MIQPLRAWHQHLFTALAVVLPVTFGAALIVRPAPPKSFARKPAGVVIHESKAGWKSHAITTRIRTSGAERTVELTAQRDILEPDLLVYLAPADPGKSLPQDALLLGSFRSGASYLLPARPPRASVLVLYSGPRREVVDAAPLGVAP